jgi:hypothetical protein
MPALTSSFLWFIKERLFILIGHLLECEAPASLLFLRLENPWITVSGVPLVLFFILPSNGLISSPGINIVTHGEDFWDTEIILFFELSTLHKNQIYLGYFTASILYLQKLCLIVLILKIFKFAIFNDDIYFVKFKKVSQHLQEEVKFEEKFFCESALINQN